jgi:hypothetical protein
MWIAGLQRVPLIRIKSDACRMCIMTTAQPRRALVARIRTIFPGGTFNAGPSAIEQGRQQMLRSLTLAALSLALPVPAQGEHFVVHYKRNYCVIVSKESEGTHHEKHKAFYSRSSAEKAMRNDPYCHNKP